MKRSEMLDIIWTALVQSRMDPANPLSTQEQVLSAMEKAGMCPPKVPVNKVRPKDFMWGVGCSMLCKCEDCNPNFLVTEWEKE
jgi:hypothetical protein